MSLGRVFDMTSVMLCAVTIHCRVVAQDRSAKENGCGCLSIWLSRTDSKIEYVQTTIRA